VIDEELTANDVVAACLRAEEGQEWRSYEERAAAVVEALREQGFLPAPPSLPPPRLLDAEKFGRDVARALDEAMPDEEEAEAVPPSTYEIVRRELWFNGQSEVPPAPFRNARP
jgi:hypothetical protein